MATSAILGQIVPVAVGSALSFKMDKKKNVAVVFFGDGAFGEGVIYESLNFASLKKLNVIFVCENNAYSTETKFDDHIAGGSLVKKAEAFGIKSFQVDGNDAQKVFDLAQDLVPQCKNGNGPFFIECMTYRWKEHCGPYYDYELDRTFRSKEELVAWFDKCPLKHLANNIVEKGHASHEDLLRMEESVKEKIHSTLKSVQQDPWPSAQEISHNIY
jgi:pyruvate dehydrogenase E1 component alpha subunit